MLTSLTAAAVLCCSLVAVGTASTAIAIADPEPNADATAITAPPPPEGAVPSATPGVYTTPEGWDLGLAASDETQIAVNPLTTAISSRQYMDSGTFTGTIEGNGSTKLAGGNLEVGYQIGCGITANVVRLSGSAGITTRGAPLLSLIPAGVAVPITGSIEVQLRPGEVTSIPVTKKEFKGTEVRVSVNHIHIKVDGCAGQSFLRSYAVLTSKTDVTDDVVAYYGVTKTV